MNHLGAVCDDFYISGRLFLKLDLNPERETILHFFDRLRKEFPGLCKLRRRENDGVVLEEEAAERGSRRWVRVDINSLRFGHFAPADTDEVRRFAEFVLNQAPYHLSFSEVDFDHFELSYGFDLEYRGNHDQLVAETLIGDSAVSGLMFGPHAAHVIDAQPYFGIALSPECDLQAYVEVKSRTTTYEVRNATFEGAPISVLLTARKYCGVESPTSLWEGFQNLFNVADELATERVVPQFVNPLAAAIASRS